MDNQTAAALDELETWADESAHKTGNEPQENAPCLEQHQMSHLKSLLRSVKGSPLPDSVLPALPR
jgi:hypothetical protein